ncbi:serine hydrolase domain-containing protein [Paenibacillus terrigena]|uniref:serine hydrolase domain-containing protein n=1 Tax=Paenibacillus terrigena TaxID=369333 RepID=UPI000376F42C|nr:serine hydrolase domain-containing protein [Paenibacillus terrigena]
MKIRSNCRYYHRAIFCLVATIMLILQLSGQPAHAASGLDHEKIDGYMKEAMRRLHIPGAAIGIIKNKEIIYLQGYGNAGPNDRLVTPDTPFLIGSTSKSFTALAIMQLVDEGKINLDAPVRKYLPQFKISSEKDSARISVRNLLVQNSGFSTYDGRRALEKEDISLKQHIEEMGDIALAEPIGTLFQYSNLNYDVLGRIVEVVSSQSFGDYIKEHIFKPLDMKHSFTSLKEGESNGLAQGYQSLFGAMMPTNLRNPEARIASGGLISSAKDMSNYLIAQMNQGQLGNIAILPEKLTDLMHQPAVSLVKGVSYGMGWIVVDNEIVWHNGGTENFSSDMMFDGEYGIVTLFNAADPFVSYDDVFQGVYKILKGENASVQNLPSFTSFYLTVGIVVVILLTLLIFSVMNLLKWEKRFSLKSKFMLRFIPVLFIFNVLLPVGALIFIPRLISASWSVIIGFSTGLGHFLIIYPIILLLIGGIKTILFIRSYLKTKQPVSL